MINSDVQKLDPGQLIDLFELDPTAIGGDIIRWHNGVNGLGADVTWQGNVYSRFPVEAAGFARTGKGAMPRPTITVANVSGLVGALVRELDDLLGSKVTRRRTFAKYLDAVNFPDGINSQADPNVGFADEIWFVDRKSAENGVFITFELSAAFDVAGVMLPRRQCIQNVCSWKYRSAECGYAGGPVADTNDIATSNSALDQCGKRLKSCKIRFGEYGQLTYGGMPGVGLVK